MQRYEAYGWHVQEVKDGKFEALIESLMEKPLDEIKELYNHREIEK